MKTSGHEATSRQDGSLQPSSRAAKRGIAALRDFAEALAFLVLLAAAQSAISLAARHSALGSARPGEGTVYGDAVHGASALASIAIYIVVVRGFERRAVSELRFDGHATVMAVRGSAMGFALFGLVVAFMLASGHGRVLGVGSLVAFVS